MKWNFCFAWNSMTVSIQSIPSSDIFSFPMIYINRKMYQFWLKSVDKFMDPLPTFHSLHRSIEYRQNVKQTYNNRECPFFRQIYDKQHHITPVPLHRINELHAMLVLKNKRKKKNHRNVLSGCTSKWHWVLFGRNVVHSCISFLFFHIFQWVCFLCG